MPEKNLAYLMLYYVEKQIFHDTPKWCVYLMLYNVEKQVFSWRTKKKCIFDALLPAPAAFLMTLQEYAVLHA